ncbi:MAG: Peptidyl-tRNA hydrolase [Verrucomicrobia subdivision 3 bacterium]|nr:Peptidyl-tRNA hydrolase [Limisphaerales bacterium]MCS1412973.1 Peptidyl-tRNA hydrolase [Limisphaerales bacterium]
MGAWRLPGGLINHYRMQGAYLVAGLGNPGAAYANTRHNAGFLAVERLGGRVGGEIQPERKFEACIGRGILADREVLFCQPQTFMNLSGRSISRILSFYKIEISHLLVLVDDVDLELGVIRLRRRGSSGGHNGLKSVAKELGTEQYARLKIGIGRQGSGSVHGYVLGRFADFENELLTEVLDRVADQVYTAVTEGFEAAMNRYNGLVTKAVD